jgi:hypothetical protein
MTTMAGWLGGSKLWLTIILTLPWRRAGVLVIKEAASSRKYIVRITVCSTKE